MKTQQNSVVRFPLSPPSLPTDVVLCKPSEVLHVQKQCAKMNIVLNQVREWLLLHMNILKNTSIDKLCTSIFIVFLVNF